MSRPLPHSPSAEQAVLGAVLIRPEVLDEIDLAPEAFHVPKNRALFEVLRDLHGAGVAIDERTVEAGLERAGRLRAVGLSYVVEVMAATVTSHNVQDYAAIVANHAKVREIQLRVSEVLAAGYTPDADGDELLAMLQAVARGVEPIRKPDVLSLRARAERRYRDLTAAAEAVANGEMPARLATGLPALDLRSGGGVPRGSASALVARPGHGKTAVVAHLLLHAPCPVLAFIFEEADRDLMDRLFAMRSGVAATRISGLQFDSRDCVRLARAGESMPRDVYTVDARGMTDEDVVRIARRMGQEHGIGLVVVDYLNRVRLSADPRLRTDERIRHCLNLFDDAAGELDVGWLVCAQANREAAKADRPPRLHEARDSGAIEEIVKWGLVVHRPYISRPKNEGGDDELHIIVDKQNLGPRVVCKFAWDGPTMTIAPLSEVDDDAQGAMWEGYR